MARLVVLLLVLLNGCASVGPTAEQLKAMDGMAASMCIESPGWNGAAVKVHVASFGGKATGTGGGGGKVVCGSSSVEFTNEGKAEKPK